LKDSIFLLLLTIILTNIPVFAQDSSEPVDTQANKYILFISPVAEVVSSRESPAFGGGFAIGSEDRVSIGARTVYFVDLESIHSVEITLFFRFYFLKNPSLWGPFAQINAGAMLFSRDKAVPIPADLGIVAANFMAGWRFLLGKTERFYIEAAVRAGMPYLIGGGITAGVRF